MQDMVIDALEIRGEPEERYLKRWMKIRKGAVTGIRDAGSPVRKPEIINRPKATVLIAHLARALATQDLELVRIQKIPSQPLQGVFDRRYGHVVQAPNNSDR